MTPFIEIILIAIGTSISCAVLGNFLILRKLSMMTDAISHTVLLGIVISFFIFQDLHSPWLLIGATLMGLLTVWGTELLIQTKLVAPDSALGLLFPFFFSCSVILINLYGANVQLDTDAVLLGELAFTPFDRWFIGDIDMGAKALYISCINVIINLSMVYLFYKELVVTTFDETFAKLSYISPLLVYYGLMSLVSLTAVVSFQAVGSILLIAFMIVPAMVAALWAKTLGKRIVISIVVGIIGSILGISLAVYYNTSLAGMMATVLCVLFLLSWCIVQGIKQYRKVE